VFGQDDQRRAGLIQPGVHTGGDLDAARQCQADVHAVVHLIRLECALDLADDLVVKRNVGKRQRERRASQSVEMLVQLEDSPVVDAQALPDGVAALNRGVERADAGLVTVNQLTVDVDQQILVLRIELLEHRSLIP